MVYPPKGKSLKKKRDSTTTDWLKEQRRKRAEEAELLRDAEGKPNCEKEEKK